ncbi:hypothetical protein O3G_MSEX010877 [Manduca sexta]|uniref:Uncharacterized protein n=1 Tax=Manduca sexta TaxID=7130 RepID=A0A921ZJ02_MANSE|nr:hypothetical protein O3G_MSEX010877 [Manduca sexta]
MFTAASIFYCQLLLAHFDFFMSRLLSVDIVNLIKNLAEFARRRATFLLVEHMIGRSSAAIIQRSMRSYIIKEIKHNVGCNVRTRRAVNAIREGRTQCRSPVPARNYYKTR